MTTTKAPKKAKAERRAKAPPADKANGKAAKGAAVADEDTRFLESKQRIMNLTKQHAVAVEIRDDLKSTVEEKKEALKTAEGNVDELTRKLWQTLAEIKNPPPLYDAEALPTGNGKAAPDLKEDESWRAVSIRSAMPGLGKRTYDALDSKNLETMGEFIDWQMKNQGWLTNIDGIGKAAVDKIADAQEAFLAKWRKENPPKPVEPKPEPSDKYEPILDEDLAGFPTIIQVSGMASRLADLKLVKVRDVFDRSKKDNAKAADWLREMLGLLHWDIVWSAINKRADEVAAKAEKDVCKDDKKAGNSSQPAGKPLVPEKAGAK